MKIKIFCMIVAMICLIVPRGVLADETGGENEQINFAECLVNQGSKNAYPVIEAESAIVIDAKSGRVLFEKKAYERRFIASTTKIMTAIVAIEKGNLNDEVTVSKRAASVQGSTIKLKKGEKMKLIELLYGLMLKSGNDAAIAIGEHVGGNLENFVDMMNKKAAQLKLKNTAFKSPHGLDADGHYSTAYELAKISQYALMNPVFSQIVRTKYFGITGRSLQNTNELLSLYPGTDGVKTGYTGKAGRCLVATVSKNDFRTISVVLNSPSRNKRAQSSIKILNYAYENYKPYTLIRHNERIRDIEIIKGIARKVEINAEDEIIEPLKESEYNNLDIEIIAPKKVEAPIIKGESVGEMIFRINGEELARTGLKAAETVRKKNIYEYFKDVIICWCGVVKST